MAEPVRVLWLTKGLGPGGAERLLLSFAQHVQRLGVDDVELHAAYLLPWKDHLVAGLEAAGVRVHPLAAPRAADPRWLGRLRRLVATERIDVVHDHSPLVAAQARPALLGRRRPALVATEHNVWASHRLPTRLANRLTIGLEDHVFAVGEEVRSSMGSLAASTEVLVQGVDVADIAVRRSGRGAARARLGLADGEVAVVNVANLRATKDHDTLLAAARRCVDEGLPLRFLSVGQGPRADELAAAADRLGLGDRLRFLGYQADPVGVLIASDVFCLSSRHEGLPIALLEALAAGLPSVVTAVGAVPSVVTDGVEGFVVQPGDPPALAGALARLVDPAVRVAMAAAASERAAAFDLGPAVDRQLAVYRALAAERRRHR